MEEIGLSGVFDLSNFDAGISSYTAAINDAVGQTEQAAGGITGAFSNMGSAITDISKVMGGVLVNAAAAAGSAIVGFIPGAIDAASDLNETVSKVGVVFKENSSQVNDWASTSATAMGISSQQALDAAGTYGALFDAMGIGAPKSAQMSEGLVQLAADLGSFNNLDPTIVLDKLRAGMTGETTGLKTLGINIDANAIKMKAMEMGLVSATGELSSSAKAQATYALVLEQTKTAQGDFARTSDGLANSTKINAAAWQDITAVIGGAFLPIQQKLTQTMGYFLSAIAPRVTEFFTALTDVVNAFVSGTPTDFPWEDIFPPWLTPVAKGVAQTFEGLGFVIQDFQSGALGLDYPWEDVFPPTIADIAYKISAAVGFVSEHFETFKGALEGVAVLIGGGILYSALGALAAAIAAINVPILLVIGASALLGAAWAGDWGGIQEIVLPIIAAVGDAIGTLVAVIDAFASGTPTDFPWEDIAPAWLVDTLYTLAHAFEDVSAAISQYGSGALAEIGAFISGNETSFTNLQAIWAQLSTSVGAVFSSLATAVSAALPGWIAALSEFGTNALTWLTDVAGKVGGAVAGFVGPLISSVAEQLPGWIAAFVGFATAAVSWIGDALPQAITALADWITGMVDYLAGNGPTQLDGASGGMVESLIGWIANDLVPKVAPAMGTFLVALVEAIGKIALALGEAALKIGIAIVGALLKNDWAATGAQIGGLIAKGFAALATLLGTAVTAAVKAITTGFTSISWGPVGSAVATSVAGGLSGAVGLFTTAITNITTAIKNAFTAINWGTVGSTVAGAIHAGIEGAKALFTAAGTVLAGAVKAAIDAVNWHTLGSTLATNINSGIESAKSTLASTAQTVATAVKNGFTTYIQWNAAVGAYMITEIGAGLSNGEQPTTTIVAKLTAAIKAGFTTAVNWLADVGGFIITQIGSGLSSGVSTLASKASEIAGGIKDAFTGFDFSTIGAAIVAGISAGFEKAKGDLIAKIKAFGDLIPGWLKQALGIASPAKKMIPIGRMIVQGLIVGIEGETIPFLNSLRTMLDGMAKIGDFNPFSNTQAVWNTWTQDFGIMTRSSGEFADTLGKLFGLTRNIVSARPDLFNPFTQSTRDLLNTVDGLEHFNDRAQRAAALLAIIRDNNLDPRAILPNNINQTDEATLALSSLEAAKILQTYQKSRLRDEQLELERAYDLRGVQAQLVAQMQEASKINPLNFFQQTEFDQINAQIATLDQKLADTQDWFKRTGDKGALDQINAMITARAKLVAQFGDSKNNTLASYVSDNANALINVLGPLGDLLTNAKTMGINTGNIFTMLNNGTDLLSAGALRAMSSLQSAVSAATAETMRNNLQAMANLSGVNMNFGLNGIGKNIGDRYASDVLQPMIDKLRTLSTLDTGRAAAMAAYNAALQKSQDLMAKENQLSFLQDQLDLLEKATGAGLDPSKIFSGLTLGINASSADLMTATSRLLDALIKTATDKLQIHSPSQVFADMGANVVKGFGLGMQRAFGQGLMQRSSVAHGPVSNRSIVVNMGGNTISSNIDGLLFEARVQRIIERSLGG